MVSLLVFYWQFDDVIIAAMTFGADIFFFMFSVVSILEWFIGQSLELCSLSWSIIKIKEYDVKISFLSPLL